jgi:hypothetical protein
MSQHNVNGLVYDAEIVNCIPDKKEKRDHRFNYCGGWHDYKGMGIAVITAYDMVARMPLVFCKGNLHEFQRLVLERQEIIGHNSRMFDDKLLAAHGINVATTYDTCEEAKLAAQSQHRTRYNPKWGGFKLQDLCVDNEIEGKRIKGSDAPKLWQMGQIGTVINYCMGDTMRTYKLFMKRRKLHCKAIEGVLELREPTSIREAVAAAERENW